MSDEIIFDTQWLRGAASVLGGAQAQTAALASVLSGVADGIPPYPELDAVRAEMKRVAGDISTSVGKIGRSTTEAQVNQLTQLADRIDREEAKPGPGLSLGDVQPGGAHYKIEQDDIRTSSYCLTLGFGIAYGGHYDLCYNTSKRDSSLTLTQGGGEGVGGSAGFYGAHSNGHSVRDLNGDSDCWSAAIGVTHTDCKSKNNPDISNRGWGLVGLGGSSTQDHTYELFHWEN